MNPKMKAWIMIQRPAVCILTVFGALCGALLVTIKLGKSLDLPSLLAGLIGGYFVAMSTQITNDVLDAEVDAIHKPHMPIPSGMVSIQHARIVGNVGYALSIMFGFLSDWWLGVTYMIIVIISIHYNLHGKGVPLVGNVEVAFCVAMIPMFGAMSQHDYTSLVNLVRFVFIFEIGREVVVTVQDRVADAHRYNTLPMVIGARKSMILGIICYGASIPFAWLQWSCMPLSWAFLGGSFGLIGWLSFCWLKTWRALDTTSEFDIFEVWQRVRGRLGILVYQFLLFTEAFL